jgi:DNA-binding PadR family transcriptional regulator
MGRSREQRQAKQRGPSSLATGVLAAIVERPSHGWEITKRLNARMGPTWRFDQRRVYEALGQLEVEGLAWSEAVRDETAPGGLKRVFHPTARGFEVCAAWLRAGGSPAQPMRGDIHAWMLLSRPEEAREILAKLAEWEQDCMEKAEASGAPADSSRSWRDRMLSQHRAAIREQYQCELRCISRARQEIEEYLSQQQQ